MKQEKYKLFKGPIAKEIPKLIAESRNILSTEKLMQFRLDNPEMYSGWDITTSDAIIYHPNGKIKIVYDSKHIKELDIEGVEQDELSNIHFVRRELEKGIYESLKGEEFLRKDLRNHLELSAKGAESSPFWQCLARHNQSLLTNYVNFVFKRGLKAEENSIVLYGDKETEETYRAMEIRLIEEYDLEELDKPDLLPCEIRGTYLRSRFIGFNSLWDSCALIGILKDKDFGERKQKNLKGIDDLPKIKRFDDSFKRPFSDRLSRRRTPALQDCCLN